MPEIPDGGDPVFGSPAGYRRSWLRPDPLAGVTVWAVPVPEALAYAGVDPVVGLYAAVPTLLLYAAAGSSRHLVVGPMSATAALSAAIVAPLAVGDPARYLALITALALAAGAVALLAGVLRLGFVAAFVSEPVLKGFIGTPSSAGTCPIRMVSASPTRSIRTGSRPGWAPATSAPGSARARWSTAASPRPR